MYIPMRTFFRYLLFSAFLLNCITSIHAQQRNIYIKFADEKKGLENAEIYSFKFELEAKKAEKKLLEIGTLDKTHDNYIAKAITGRGQNSGRTRINVPSNGWLVIDLIESRFIISVASTKVVDNEYIIELKKSRTDEMFEKMKDTNISGKRTGRKTNVPGEGSTCGGVLVVKPYPIYIDSIYARNNARFVVSPIVLSRNNPKDTIGFLPPRVLDGVDYAPSQVRYTGFDQETIGNKKYNKNDKYYANRRLMGDESMSGYFNTGMETRKEDTIYFQCKIRPYVDSIPWKIVGHCWYEDYKTVYFEKNILLYAGYTTKPARFLEWRTSIPEAEIDVSHYTIMARTEAITTPMTLKLDFKSGEAALNYADSMTMVNLNTIEQKIQNILNNENAEFHGISLHGYASPEGSEATNRNLAQKRTQTVRDYLSQRFSNNLVVKQLDSEIVPWTEVADTLEAINAEGYAEMAQEIRNICEQKKNLDEQGRLISSKGYTNKLKEDKILDRMRRVRIETEYVEQKELTSKEIFQRYENEATKKPFIDGDAPAYQYFQLMNYLYDNQDWNALYDISKIVYQKGKIAAQEKDDGNQLLDIAIRSTITNEIEKIKTKQVEIEDSLGRKTTKTQIDTLYVMKTDTIRRPFPLAAYYWAKCKLERGEKDTLLLQDYLDDSNGGLFSEAMTFDGAPYYWNEEPIVITHILMHCALEDFSRARFHSLYHLPKDGQYDKFQSFLKFLSCDYEDDKERIRQIIEETSPINFVVANLTKEYVNGEVGFKRALNKLNESQDEFLVNDTLSSDYYYLLAICKYQVECSKQDYETYYYDSRNAYDPNPESMMNWGAPMLEAIRLDPKWADFLKEDGYFNDAYRTMILYFWQRMQDGAEMADIAKEYDTLAKKYFKPEKQQSNSKKR